MKWPKLTHDLACSMSRRTRVYFSYRTIARSEYGYWRVTYINTFYRGCGFYVIVWVYSLGLSTAKMELQKLKCLDTLISSQFFSYLSARREEWEKFWFFKNLLEQKIYNPKDVVINYSFWCITILTNFFTQIWCIFPKVNFWSTLQN